MRFNTQVTATALMVAMVAVGCSKSDENKTSEPTARLTPISMVDESAAVKPANKSFDNPELPPVGPVSFADGEAAYQHGDYSKAAGIFEQYTIDKPNNAWGHYMFGLSAWKSGDPVKAESAFEQALSLDPKHFKSMVNLSRVLIDQARYDEALDNLVRASEIDENSVDVQRLLGRTYAAQGKTEEAVDAYRRAIALDGKDAWSMNNLGFLFLEQGRATDALPLLARAVELKGDVPVFHNNLGMALEHTGRFTAAAAEYNSALAVDPGYQKALSNLARVEAVKVTSEEPFDLEGTAHSIVQEEQPSVDGTASNQ